MSQRYKDALFGGVLVLLGHTSGQSCGSEKKSASTEAIAQEPGVKDQVNADVMAELKRVNELLSAINVHASFISAEAQKIGHAFNKSSDRDEIVIDDYPRGVPYQSLRVAQDFGAVFKTSETETVNVLLKNSNSTPINVKVSTDLYNPIFIAPGYSAEFKVSESNSLGVKVRN